MKIQTLGKILATAATTAIFSAQAADISDDVIRIGFITDMAGVYASVDGKAGAHAIRMAIEDAGGEIDGKKIELIAGDHQNKPDVAASLARRWFDERKLDMLIGGANSAASVAMASIAADNKKPYIVVGGGSSAVTNEHCTPYTIHYAYNTESLANGAATAIVEEGKKSWFYISNDYVFGHTLQAEAAKAVEAAGGQNLGAVFAPLGTLDFSSYVLQAQSSGAQVLGFANAGADFVNAAKSAGEFGITKDMQMAGLLTFITEIHTLGLENTGGMYLTTPWYWDLDDETRAWSERFFSKNGHQATFVQAADYAAALSYLDAVKSIGSDDGDKVMDYFRSHTFDNMFIKDGHLREDGLLMHPMYLAQVKTPEESKGDWDYYKIVRSIPAETVFGPISESKCDLINSD